MGRLPFLLLGSDEWWIVLGILFIHEIKLVVLSYVGNSRVKEFINTACKMLNIKIKWVGKGINEKAYEIKKNKKKLMIVIDKRYFRPLDINYLKGNPSKAKKILKYKIKYKFKDLVKDMILSDIFKARKKSINN